MTTRLSRFAARSVAAVGTMLVTAVCWAQEAAPSAPVPPTPSKPDDPPAIMSFLILIATGALIIGANAMATKRGHQD
ncbi:MAG: hypothetical protein SFY69_01370 [Planctomycetota bacterium]|nr:hypothetical protein [Planctomycetota bacterium]